MSKKLIALLILGLLGLTLTIGGCGGSDAKKEATLVAGKEAVVKTASFMAMDEVNGKNMIQLQQTENDPVLGKLVLDKVIDGIDEGAKVKVVSQQGTLVKANYIGKDVFLWANHLKQ